jgi:hypothetical protein
MFVLRKSGGGEMYVKNLPHDHDPENFVMGQENPSVLKFETRRQVLTAKLADPDGKSLIIEKI